MFLVTCLFVIILLTLLESTRRVKNAKSLLLSPFITLLMLQRPVCKRTHAKKTHEVLTHASSGKFFVVSLQCLLLENKKVGVPW